MSLNNAHAFIERLQADKGLQKQLPEPSRSKGAPISNVVALGKSVGLDFSVDDYKKATREWLEQNHKDDLAAELSDVACTDWNTRGVSCIVACPTVVTDGC
jgi:predicted ribosomally synthesized peptide with nif11-like leader